MKQEALAANVDEARVRKRRPGGGRKRKRPDYDAGRNLEELMDAYEKSILESMLAKYKRASEVGRALNVNKSTLSRRMKKYGLE